MLNKILLYFKSRFPIIPLFAFNLLITWGIEKLITKNVSITGVYYAIILVLFYLHLRLLDEFKDYKFDSKFHPDRPIQSGKISLDEIKKGLLFCDLSMLGMALVTRFSWLFLPAYLYTFLMYKEFFIKDFYEKSPLLYLISHELVFLFLYYFTVSNLAGWEISPYSLGGIISYLYLIIPVTLVEIGRKMNHRYDPKGNKTTDTYAYVWGEKTTIAVYGILCTINAYLFTLLTSSKQYALLIPVFYLLAVSGFNENIKIIIMKHHMLITTVVSMLFPLLLIL